MEVGTSTATIPAKFGVDILICVSPTKTILMRLNYVFKYLKKFPSLSPAKSNPCRDPRKIIWKNRDSGKISGDILGGNTVCICQNIQGEIPKIIPVQIL